MASRISRTALSFAIALIVVINVSITQFAPAAYGDEGDASADASAVVQTASGESDSGSGASSESGDVSSGSSSSASSADSASSKKDEGEPEQASAGSGGNLVDPTQRADNSFIYDTTIDSLFDQAALYEGDTVQVEGEAIGDLISAGAIDGRELYWVMLTSTDAENKASISVLMTAEQAKQVDHLGRYGVTGTILQVRGIFHQACAEHEGLPDIHATNVNAITRGSEHADVLRLREFIPGVVTVIVGIILMGVYYFIRERSR